MLETVGASPITPTPSQVVIFLHPVENDGMLNCRQSADCQTAAVSLMAAVANTWHLEGFIRGVYVLDSLV